MVVGWGWAGGAGGGGGGGILGFGLIVIVSLGGPYAIRPSTRQMVGPGTHLTAMLTGTPNYGVGGTFFPCFAHVSPSGRVRRCRDLQRWYGIEFYFISGLYVIPRAPRDILSTFPVLIGSDGVLMGCLLSDAAPNAAHDAV